MTNIEWTEVPDGLDFSQPVDELCECPLKEDPRCTLTVEEGRASVRHVACGLPLWLEEYDIWAEFPVRVTIEVCGNPGGWHGLERCDCGPEVAIEHDPDRT